MKAYVYTHTRLDTNEIFYVGIGTQDNYRRASKTVNRSVFWKNIINKTGWKVDIVFDNLSWDKACEIEKELIIKYGRKDLCLGSLVNLTDGGDGNSGRKISQETRQKMSNMKKGVPKSDEHKKNMSIALKNNNSTKVIDTNTGFIYNSVHEAAEENGLKNYVLSNYLTGRTKNNTTLKYYIDKTC